MEQRTANNIQNPGERHIYEEIISRPDTLIEMALVTEALGLPAVCVPAREIEAYCESTPGLDITDEQFRRRCGKMVKRAMEELGYETVKERPDAEEARSVPFPEGLGQYLGIRHFKGGALYRRRPGVSLPVALEGRIRVEHRFGGEGEL